VFLIGAVTMLAAFLLITTIPEVPIGSGAPSDEASQENNPLAHRATQAPPGGAEGLV
jgi:hypothetical protein